MDEHGPADHEVYETYESEAPVTLEPEDVPPERRHEFRFDPVLTMFDGPWIVRRSPGMGTAVRCAAITFLLAIIALIATDRTIGPGILDGNIVMGTLILGALATALLWVLAGGLMRGRALHVPSGRRYARVQVRGSGDHGFAARTFTEVAAGTATAASVVGDGRIGADIGVVHTRVYQCSRPAEVWAAVHFVAPDGVITAWPPVPITFDEAIALTPANSGSTAVDVSAIGD
ncbi:hypothetical protein [Brevibacterium yomogidense]|uniref:hypothetical protein n=1 Tax=Brevibacterium yomogidense TaxID=946573 RepID=UPI000B35F546|nr:hypothetical protein [Brevibacterium yomogidense]